MTILTHSLVTIAGSKMLNLNTTDTILALTFGVLTDFDHVLKVPMYLKENGFKMKRHFNWRTPLQEPIALTIAGPISLQLNTWIPVIFLSLHILMDYMMQYWKKPFFPLSSYKTRGFFPKVSDFIKELIIALIACLSLLQQLLTK